MLGEQTHLLESFRHAKTPRPVANDHHVIRFLHNRLRKARNVFNAPHARDRSGAVRRPVHDAGVEFHFPFFVGQPAVANGVIVRIVLDDSDGRNDSVQRVAAALEYVHAFVERMQTVGARNNERPLALHSRRRACESRRIAVIRTRASEYFVRAGNGAPRERSKKEFTA